MLKHSLSLFFTFFISLLKVQINFLCIQLLTSHRTYTNIKNKFCYAKNCTSQNPLFYDLRAWYAILRIFLFKMIGIRELSKYFDKKPRRYNQFSERRYYRWPAYVSLLTLLFLYVSLVVLLFFYNNAIFL